MLQLIVSCYQTSTSRKLSLAQSDEEEQVFQSSHTSGPAKEDQVFQETYMETTGAKYSRSRGHGYLLNPKRKQAALEERIIQERKERLKEQERQLQEKMKLKRKQRENNLKPRLDKN